MMDDSQRASQLIEILGQLNNAFELLVVSQRSYSVIKNNRIAGFCDA